MGRLFGLTGLLLMAAMTPAGAIETGAVFNLTIQDHKFTPSVITVPAGKAVVIAIKNLDAQAEEFDSTDLRIEKIVAGKGEGNVHLHPLDAGTYHFTGEYHTDTAQGTVVAK